MAIRKPERSIIGISCHLSGMSDKTIRGQPIIRAAGTIRIRSRNYNARFTATHRTVSVCRVLQMRGGGYADVLPVLQVPDNKADAVPCERLPQFKGNTIKQQ
ncbi:MAG: hypothetical protein K8R75_02285 [Deltaproteobacteria bacterium]|nr:hypothetical protein [Deltaproteobacteria bacterium]